MVATLLLLSPQTSNAQSAGNSVHGTVNSAEGQPLVGAIIQIEGTKHTINTDSKGSFRFADIAPGSHSLTISYVGFKTQKKTINVKKELISSLISNWNLIRLTLMKWLSLVKLKYQKFAHKPSMLRLSMVKNCTIPRRI